MSKIKYYIPKVRSTRINEYGAYVWSRPINLVCKTDGMGLWSRTSKKVTHKKLELTCYGADDDLEFAFGCYELKVFFTKKDWDTKKNGLIYTDDRWENDFRKGLVDMGFSKVSTRDCGYSEQGMQKKNYVSLDAGPKFAKEFFRVLYQQQ